MQIKAIVFDTNVFGKGALPNVGTVANWFEACDKNDAELWIPEICAFELAEHAVSLHESHLQNLRSFARDVDRWGLCAPEVPQPIDSDDILGALAEAGARLIPLEGVDAREALLDQVSQRHTGERRSGVKTGAADSAWLRSVATYNGGNFDGLLIVSGDSKAITQVAEALGVDEPRTAANLGEISALAGDAQVADAESEEAFSAWLTAEFRQVPNPARHAIDVLGLGDDGWWDPPALPDDSWEQWELQSPFVNGLEDVVIHGPITNDRWAGTLRATVDFELNVDDSAVRQDPWGDELQTLYRIYPVHVRADLLVFYDGTVVSFDGAVEEVEVLPVDPDAVI